MAVISSNEIVVGYKVVGQAELQQLAAQFEKVTQSEKESLDEFRKLNNKAKETTETFRYTGEAGKKAGNETSKAFKDTDQSLGKFSTSLKGIGPLIAGAFAVGSIIAFGKSVFDTTSRFEKLSAVLKNTLGSGSAAAFAIENIKNFAKTTPFSVEELTASFVKLANQGFKPTTDQMRRLGDLASSTGKSFDQLSEAIIDAQVGEFERLKEFGVRAEKAGDQVRFTFKGVQTQVAFTNEAIRQYLVSLGDYEGVAGAAAAISDTLGGKVNNLGDAWDNFLNKIGTLLKPILTEALNVTADFMDQINGLFGGVKSDSERFLSTELQTYQAYQQSAISMTDKQLEDFVSKQKLALKESQNELKKNTQELNKYGKAERLAAEVGFGQKSIVDAQKAAEKANQDIAASKGRIAAAEEQIKIRADATNKTSQQYIDLEKQKVKEKEKQQKLDEKEYNQKLAGLEKDKQIRALELELQKVPEAALIAENEFLVKKYQLQKEYLGKVAALNKTELQLTESQQEKANANLGKFYDEMLLKQKFNLDGITNGAKKAESEADKEQQAGIQRMKDWQANYEAQKQEEVDAQKKADKQKAQANQIYYETAAYSVQQLFQLQQQYLQNEMTLQAKKFDEEIRLADGNEQKITEINERRLAAEKEIRIKQFRSQQAAAIADVVFRVAPIIAQQIAGVVTAPLAIASYTAAAAQIAFILAQPVPEFYKGVENFEGGFAKVGERGSELIETPKGTFLSPDKPTLTYLPKGTNVITATKTKERMQILNSSFRKGQDKFQSIDTTPIASEIAKMPVAINRFDENGFTQFVRQGNRTTRILNKRKGY